MIRAMLLLCLFTQAVAGAAVPERPEIPAALQRKVQHLRELVTKVSEECQDQGERNGGPYDEARCPGWFRELSRGGEAAVHAIAHQALGEDEEAGADFGSAASSMSRLMDILAWSGSRTAVVYLLRVGGALSTIDDNERSNIPGLGETELFEALRTVTGCDAGSMPYWWDGEAEAIQKASQAWLAWYAAHQSEDRAAWIRFGLADARAKLSSSDAEERLRAIERLLMKGGDRPAALASLQALLSSPTVSADVVDAADGLARTYAVPKTLLAAAEKARDEGAPDAAKTGTPSVPPAPVAAPPVAGTGKALFKKCTTAFYALRLQDSLAACTAAAKADGGDIEALVGRGWAELELERTEDALKTAEAAKKAADATRAALADELLVAVKTVKGDVDDAKKLIATALQEGRITSGLRSRLGLLSGRPASVAWVRYVAPRYFCWSQKGPDAARKFLVRRGFPKPQLFTDALAQLPGKERDALNARGLKECPWRAVLGGAEVP